MIERSGPRGLALSVVDGLEIAREPTIVVMDADLSHPPEALPDLVGPIVEGDAEFVLGSRYVPGARIDDRWSWFRRLNSKVSTLIARPLVSLHDPMSGFFAFSRSILSPGVELNPTGYKIGLELLVKTGCKEVLEVPIRFYDRKRGRSKLGVKPQIQYPAHLVRLYRHTLRARRTRAIDRVRTPESERAVGGKGRTVIRWTSTYAPPW